MKNPVDVHPGTVVQGKWHKQTYRIVRKLGSGANGSVYLAEVNGKKVAMKMSRDVRIITSEVNVLKSFAKAQGDVPLGPSLFDVDDWNVGTNTIPFYVMEYINGTPFLHFIEQKGKSWVPVLILQLLSELDKLHHAGWIFGDLKPENLIVTSTPFRVRCVDVGGATQHSRSVKEFTEFFDRGFWGLGSRKAEPSYDLFAVAMIMINCYYPNRFPKKEGGLVQLRRIIRENRELARYEDILLKAITGKYTDARHMHQEMIRDIQRQASQGKGLQQTQGSRRQKSPQKKVRSRFIGVLETILIIFIICFLYVAYIMEKIM